MQLVLGRYMIQNKYVQLFLVVNLLVFHIALLAILGSNSNEGWFSMVYVFFSGMLYTSLNRFVIKTFFLAK